MALFSKKSLGVDIGTSSIKVVELSQSFFSKKKKLENYAQFCLPVEHSSIKTFNQQQLTLFEKKTAQIMKAVIKKGNFKGKSTTFALPDFSSLFATFKLPPMGKSEIPQAVEFEARHYVPISLSKVSFDWQIIEKGGYSPDKKNRVLLVAIPNRILDNYQKMVNLTQLELEGMESGVFSFIRSSIPEKIQTNPICLVDIGWQSTTVSIAWQGNLHRNRGFDISGESMAKKLSNEMNVSLSKAEKIKRDEGLNPNNETIINTLSPDINSLIGQIKKLCKDFYKEEGREIENLILAGGTSSMFGFKEYLESRVNQKVSMAFPFGDMSYPSKLYKRLEEIGPSLVIATGAALTGLRT